MSGTDLIPRATIAEICAHRDRALTLYEEAHAALSVANDAVVRAHRAAELAHGGHGGAFHEPDVNEIIAFRRAIQFPQRDSYLRTARKLVDGRTWASIVERTDLERLMDAQAKAELREQMAYVPDRTDRDGQLITGEEAEKGLPEITVENVYATLQHFAASSESIFRRGIANAFSKLDRRFKSHDGFKVGSRIILVRVFNDWGSWNGYGVNGTRDILMDVERAFAVLDGKEVGASYATTIGQIERERDRARAGLRGKYSEHDTEYFKVRCYINGNMHLWFQRKDLVEKVNRILADWYGEVVGDARTPEEDPLEKRKTTLARHFGFFPTPKAAAEELLSKVSLYHKADSPPLRILEPSAGTGALAYPLAEPREDVERRRHPEPDVRRQYRNLVDCIEIQPHHAAGLEQSGRFNRVICGDFLTMPPPDRLYDRVVMNPPFDLERDVDHVVHALKWLAEDGELHAIMSAGTVFRSTRKAEAFRALIERMNGEFRDLPVGSFASQGTNVNTVILRLNKSGAKRWW